MPPGMHRLGAAVIFISVIMFAGCVTIIDGTPHSAPTHDPGDDFPNEPANFTRQSVLNYAKLYERAVVANKLQGPSVESITVTCPMGTIVSGPAGGYYTSVTCEAAATGPNVDKDYGQTTAFYNIQPTSTTRIGPSDIQTITIESTPPTSIDYSHLLVVNFDAQSHQYHLTVRRQNQSNGVSLNSTRTLPPATGMKYNFEYLAAGTYRLSLSIGSERHTYTWDRSEQRDASHLAIIIGADGSPLVIPLNQSMNFHN